MLMCWNGEPQNRPKFTELRAKFDAMLLADKKDVYIDLRIDSDKPYYLLDTMATLATKGLQISPTPSRHSFMLPTAGDSELNKECSPNRLLTPKLSPCRKSQDSSCLSVQNSPMKSDCTAAAPALSSSPYFNSCECIQVSENSENREREVAHDGQRRRPTSMLLPFDHDRRERQNPYVDEPSRRAAATTLTLAPPNHDTREHARREIDGAIEMNRLASGENHDVGIHITITEDCH